MEPFFKSFWHHGSGLGDYQALDLIFLAALAISFWHFLLWLKKTRYTPSKKNKLAETKPCAKIESNPKNEIVVRNQAQSGVSGPGFYGFTEDELKQALDKIQCKGSDHSYLRGVAVYSMSSVANIGSLATGAYAYPDRDGWEERDENNVLVRDLSWDWTNSSATEVLKLHLNNVEVNHKHKYGYFRFTVGWSSVFTDVLTTGVPDPQELYILLRSGSVMGKNTNELTAQLSYRTLLCRTVVVDFEPVQLSELRKNPRQMLKAKDGSVTVYFQASFMSFKTATSPSETNKPEGSDAWKQEVPIMKILDCEIDWSTAIDTTLLGKQDFETCVYIDDTVSSTQCWIFRLPETKTVVVAFRGTQTDRSYDIAVDGTRDFRVAEEKYGFGSDDTCILDLNPSIKQLDLMVHSGYLNGYKTVRSALLEVVYQMTDNWNPEYSIVVTGHSLGGSLGVLCATELANRTLNGKRPNVSTLVLASVCTGNTKFVNFYIKSVPNSFRVLNELDEIGGSLFDLIYKHVSYELWFADDPKRTVTLPDSSQKEKHINQEISELIIQYFAIARLGPEAVGVYPEGLFDHIQGRYLGSTSIVAKYLHNLPYRRPDGALEA